MSDMMNAMTSRRQPGSNLRRSDGRSLSWEHHRMEASARRQWVAPVLVLLQLAALAPYLLAGLIAPERQLMLVRALWLVLAVVAVVVYRRNRLLSLTVPVATVLIGIALLPLGAAFLDWEG
jgi:hypothetical protein